MLLLFRSAHRMLDVVFLSLWALLAFQLTPALAQQRPSGFQNWQLQVFWCEPGGEKYEAFARKVESYLKKMRDNGGWDFVRNDKRGITIRSISESELNEVKTYPNQPGTFVWNTNGVEIRWNVGEEDEAAWLKRELEAVMFSRFDLLEVGSVFNNQLSITVCPTKEKEPNPPSLTGAAAQNLAIQCANLYSSKNEIEKFAQCTGHRFVLPEHDELLITCLQSNGTSKIAVADCAAPPLLKSKLTEEDQKTLQCAYASNGDAIKFGECLGSADSITLNESLSAAASCLQEAQSDAGVFALCAGNSILDSNVSDEQQKAITCAWENESAEAFAGCVGALGIDELTGVEKKALECIGSLQKPRDFMYCVGSEVLNVNVSSLKLAGIQCAWAVGANQEKISSCAKEVILANFGENEQHTITCAATSQGDVADFARCAGPKLIGVEISKEQSSAVKCAAQSGGSAEQFGSCAISEFINADLGLTQEQSIALQCVTQTGGQPWAAAGCAATRLTFNELTKCAQGIGGDGCFGDSNDIVGKNGWTARTLRNVASDITEGPGENNELFGRNGFMAKTFGWD